MRAHTLVLSKNSSHTRRCVRSKIRETLNNLILHSPQEWQTGVGLPFVKIDGTTVEWDVSAIMNIHNFIHSYTCIETATGA